MDMKKTRLRDVTPVNSRVLSDDMPVNIERRCKRGECADFDLVLNEVSFSGDEGLVANESAASTR